MSFWSGRCSVRGMKRAITPGELGGGEWALIHVYQFIRTLPSGQPASASSLLWIAASCSANELLSTAHQTPYHPHRTRCCIRYDDMLRAQARPTSSPGVIARFMPRTEHRPLQNDTPPAFPRYRL